MTKKGRSDLPLGRILDPWSQMVGRVRAISSWFWGTPRVASEYFGFCLWAADLTGVD